MRETGPSNAERIADFIRKHGPSTQSSIATGLGLTGGTVCMATRKKGFGRVVEDGRLLITVIGEVKREKPGRKPAPKKPKPKKAERLPSGEHPKGSFPQNLVVVDPEGLKKRIAAYLDKRGPVWGDVAAYELGITPVQWWDAVKMCSWFTFDAKGPAGWQLTDRGRAEAFPKPQGGEAA